MTNIVQLPQTSISEGMAARQAERETKRLEREREKLLAARPAEISFQASKRIAPPKTLCDYLFPVQEGGINILYGDSNAGKTYALLHMALMELCSGNKVYDVMGEGLNIVGRRITAWESYYLYDKQLVASDLYDPENNGIFTRHAIDFMDSTAIDALIIRLQEFQPKFLIIDTVSNCIEGTDQNNSAPLSRFTGACKRIRDCLFTINGQLITIVAVHHTGKNADKGLFGNSVLIRDVDTITHMAGDLEGAIFKCEKVRGTEFWGERYFRKLKVDGENDQILIASDTPIVVSGAKEITPTGWRILQFLSQPDWLQTGAMPRQIMDGLRLSGETQFNWHKSFLIEQKLLDHKANRSPYKINSKGLEELAKKGMYANEF